MSSTTRERGVPFRRPRLAALVAAFALCAAGTPVLAEGSPVRLDWTSIEGARSYLVEIRASGGAGLVLSASAIEPWIEAPLAPGDYEIRVSALNVFGKAVASGEWTAFSVRATARLEVPSLLSAPEPDPAEPGRIIVRVAVSGALPETVASLEGQGVRIEADSVALEEAGLAASFDLSGVPEGDYDLVLENPGGYSTRIAGAVRAAAPEPVAGTELEPEPDMGTELEAGTELAAGTELEPESAGVAAAPESEPERVTGTELESGAAHKPGPESTSRTELAGSMKPEIGTELPTGTDLEAEPAPVPLRLDLSLGWRPSLPLDADWGGSYKMGFVAAEAALGLALVEPAPAWLRALSLELRVDGFRLPGNTGPFVDRAEALALSAALELGVSFQPLPWLELVLRGGASLWATHVARTGMIGDFDAWSFGDMAAQGSLASRFLFGRFALEAGCAWQHVFYLDVPADFLRPFLRFGWSFGP